MLPDENLSPAESEEASSNLQVGAVLPINEFQSAGQGARFLQTVAYASDLKIFQLMHSFIPWTAHAVHLMNQALDELPPETQVEIGKTNDIFYDLMDASAKALEDGWVAADAYKDDAMASAEQVRIKVVDVLNKAQNVRAPWVKDRAKQILEAVDDAKREALVLTIDYFHAKELYFHGMNQVDTVKTIQDGCEILKLGAFTSYSIFRVVENE